jgi:hypothetical protein
VIARRFTHWPHRGRLPVIQASETVHLSFIDAPVSGHFGCLTSLPFASLPGIDVRAP